MYSINYEHGTEVVLKMAFVPTVVPEFTLIIPNESAYWYMVQKLPKVILALGNFYINIQQQRNDPTVSMQRPNIYAYRCIMRFYFDNLVARVFVKLFLRYAPCHVGCTITEIITSFR